jgi:hypothetical protein
MLFYNIPLRQQILGESQDALNAGHFGSGKTLSTVQGDL